MAQANDSVLVTPGTGATVATHLANAKEHQVNMEAESDGHIKKTRDAYSAVYKLAQDTPASALTFTFVANTDKCWASIYHSAASVKLVKILAVEFHIAATAATILNIELRAVTTQGTTGNPVITPRQLNPASAAAEAICWALQTNAPGFPSAQALFSQEINLGANTAQTTGFAVKPITLWPPESILPDDLPDLILRPGVAEGYAIWLRSTAAVAIKGTARIVFTENTP